MTYKEDMNFQTKTTKCNKINWYNDGKQGTQLMSSIWESKFLVYLTQDKTPWAT